MRRRCGRGGHREGRASSTATGRVVPAGAVGLRAEAVVSAFSGPVLPPPAVRGLLWLAAVVVCAAGACAAARWWI